MNGPDIIAGAWFSTTRAALGVPVPPAYSRGRCLQGHFPRMRGVVALLQRACDKSISAKTALVSTLDEYEDDLRRVSDAL
jgi:hypothetical protein